MMHRTYITTGERIRTYVAVAFALSLLINAATTLVMPDISRHYEDASPPIVTIDHRHPAVIRRPRPTPPPTPVPRRPVRAVQKPFAAAVPHVRAIAHGGPARPRYVAPKMGSSYGTGPDVTATSAPIATAPAATPSPSCANPNQDARVTNAIAPDYPDSARSMGYGAVSVLVQVTLDANGTLAGAAIAQSSGNAAFDRAALRAARESTYASRIVNCQPAAGAYIFRADFTP